jgi:hypothetical protein
MSGRTWQHKGWVVLLLGLLCAVSLAPTHADAQITGRLPLDVLLLIDHSDSMWDKGGVGSDPGMLRVEAANLFVAYLGADTARPGSRLGVIHFGGESVLAVPLTPLDSAARRRTVRAAIADSQRMGWTDPLAALRLAYETLFPRDRRNPGRQPVVILLSDGKPELSPAPSAEEWSAYMADLRALVERFREHGCPIFTIALSNAATDADPDIQTVYRNLWQEIAACTPPAEYHEARAGGDLSRIYHAIVARLTGAEGGAPVVNAVVEEQTTATIVMGEGVAQARFVILRSGGAVTARLLRPEGIPIRPGDPDVAHTGDLRVGSEEVWVVSDPRPGRWTLVLEGGGEVLVWLDTVPGAESSAAAYVVEVAMPTSHLPAGQSVDVGVVVRETVTGSPVVGADLQVVAEVRRAGLAEATLLAHDDGQGCDARAGDGRYCITLSDPPPGACTLLVHALLSGAEIAHCEVAFEAVILPKLEVVSPRPGQVLEPTASLVVNAHVLSGERPLTGEELAACGVLTASLCSTDAGKAVIPMVETGGAFIGHTAVPADSGPFTVTVRLRGETVEGLPFEDVVRVPLRVAASGKTAGPWIPYWILLPVGLALTGGTLGVVLIRRRRACIVLDGSLRVLAAPEGRPLGRVIDLPAVSHVILGGSGGEALLSSESPCAVLHAERTPEGEVETWVEPLEGEGTPVITLNGDALVAVRRLCDGDTLAFDGYRLRYESLRQAGARRARRRPQRKRPLDGGVR